MINASRVDIWYRRSVRVLVSIFFLITLSLAADANTAIAEFQTIQEKLRAARSNQDWTVSLASANDLTQLLNGQPDGILELARAKVHTGDVAGALRDLEQFARMGQSTDLVSTSPEFAPLREKPEFVTIQAAMKENRSAISLGTVAVRLSNPALLPEDLDHDPDSKRFFITTVRGKKIISADETGTISDFAEAPDDWPLLAIKIDSKRNLVWATEVALQGFVFVPSSDWGRSAVLCYDLKAGKLLHRIEGPRSSGLGDMTLAPNGDVIVSDGDGGGVYRVPAGGNELQRLDTGDFISPQTPAVYPDGKKIFVPDYLSGIGVLEVSTKQVHWLNPEGRFARSGRQFWLGHHR